MVHQHPLPYCTQHMRQVCHQRQSGHEHNFIECHSYLSYRILLSPLLVLCLRIQWRRHTLTPLHLGHPTRQVDMQCLRKWDPYHSLRTQLWPIQLSFYRASPWFPSDAAYLHMPFTILDFPEPQWSLQSFLSWQVFRWEATDRWYPCILTDSTLHSLSSLTFRCAWTTQASSSHLRWYV